MGLALQVGYLADLIENDPEGAEESLQDFAQVNIVLKKHGLRSHDEPTVQTKGGVFSCDMWGYSGLHYLRRIAAHLELRGALPDPGNGNASKDPVVEEYWD